MSKTKPYHKNVSGDFYVEDGCCITCMVPEVYAPDLMSFDESQAHCFVAKQPTDSRELYQAIKATWAAEVGCIRYAGNNLDVLRRLAEAGLSERCDEQYFVQKIRPLYRNHVVFESTIIQSESELAQQARNYILSQNTEHPQEKISEITEDESGSSFSLSWYENKYYSIWFSKIESKNAWHIFHSPEYEEIGSKSVSVRIDEWLKSNKDFVSIKWLTNKTWNDSLTEWQATPI